MAEEFTGANGEEQYMESTEQTEHQGAEASQLESNDKNEGKIFVGGLSWETTVKDLKEYFQKYGTVLDCTLKTDPTTGRSRGFGFVLFEDSESVEKVLNEKQHMLHGRNIDPKRAKARGGREPILKVFVGGLDPTVPEDQIRSYFERFGKVTELDLPFDKQKGQRRAFCFVSFESEEIVDKVCEQPKQDIEGKRVDVKKATPKNEQYGGGYGGGGYGYGGRGGRGGYDSRGRGGRGRGRGEYSGYGQSGWGGQGYGNGGYGSYDYSSYPGYGGYGNDYYGNYDYNSYYNQGWGNQGGYGSYGTGYGSGYGDGTDASQGDQSGGYKAKRGGGSQGYHPYSR